jgi:hypothetical protein
MNDSASLFLLPIPRPRGLRTSPFLAGLIFDQPGFRGFGFSETGLLAALIQTILALEQQKASSGVDSVCKLA